MATLSGDVAADFAAIVPGVRAYFDMVNAEGGVDGRKIVLAKALDDGTAQQRRQVTRTLVQQDHVFARRRRGHRLLHRGQPFLVQTGTPTFGFATQNDWTPAPRTCSRPTARWSVLDDRALLRLRGASKLHAHVAAVDRLRRPAVGRRVPATPSTALGKYGVPVGYTDLSPSRSAIDLSSDVVHMKQAGVDFVVSCMDVPGNMHLSRAMQQNGLGGRQAAVARRLRPSDAAPVPLAHAAHLLPGPARAVPGGRGVPRARSPGLENYIATMNRYEPADTYSEVAIEGWLSAALFVARPPGGRARSHPGRVGRGDQPALRPSPAGGPHTPVNWTVGHTRLTSPSCETFVEAVGTTSRWSSTTARRSVVCFPTGRTANLAHPVPPPPGHARGLTDGRRREAVPQLRRARGPLRVAPTPSWRWGWC